MLVPTLLALITMGAPSSAPPANLGYYMEPSIRGNNIVFVSQGDIWRVGAEGGLAHALTSHVAPASNPALSPDGTMVAFTGTYEGPDDAYVMSLEGDLPKRLTYEGGMWVNGWTPGGKLLVATNRRSTFPATQLITVDAVTRRQETVPLSKASEGSYDATGKTLFFTRFAFQGSHTKRYKGGTAQNIWKYSDGAAEAMPLTANYTGTSKNPMWFDHRVYFLSDRDGWMNLWSMDESGGGLKQLTRHQGWDIQSASMDAGRVVYQLGADLHLLDVSSGSDKALDIRLASDFDQSRERWIKNPMAYLTAMSPSSDGQKLALTARGQVFVAPVESGRFVEATRKPGVRYREGMFTPDGKSVLALSDQTGEAEWWRLPANGIGTSEQLTHDSKVLTMNGAVSPDGMLLAYVDRNQDLWIYDLVAKKATKAAHCEDGQQSDLRWSPDSQWLAYTMPTFTFSRIVLYGVKSGQNTPVTTPRADSSSPAWSPDGKWLYFLSDRTFRTVVGSPWGPREPEPFFDRQTKIYMLGLVKGLRSPFQAPDELFTAPTKPASAASPTVTIDLDGLPGRLWEVPIAAGNYGNLYANAEKLFLQSSAVGGSTDLASVEVTNKDVALKTLVPAISGYQLTRDGKHLMVVKGGHIYVVAATVGPNAPLQDAVNLSNWSFPLDPREEWRQMFVEAWRLERDYFYDPHLHSVDWPAVLARYRPLADRVRDRSELSNLLAQMVGELSALHTFVYGGDNRGPSDSVFPASLGALLTRDEANGGYRIDRIYSGEPDYPESLSPLVRPGVDASVGDVIQSVNGIDTLSVPDIEALLRNQAGKQLLIHLKQKSTGTGRDCIVVPMDGGADGNLRYTDWEVSRRLQVEGQSKGTVGYVHLRAMGSGDIAQWARDFYPAFDKAGLIIDVRHNNGGNIDSWIIEKLLRKAWFFWQDRVGHPTWNMQWAFRGHVVVLCDENTASDGEAFTEGIKRLGIGKVIGTRTWGGEIWLSSDNVLVDRGIATAAETGVFGPEGKWLIEGHGVDPDFVVDDLPHATFMGQDAQLQAALDYLEKEIRAKPVLPPKTPPYPNKGFPVKVGSGSG